MGVGHVSWSCELVTWHVSWSCELACELITWSNQVSVYLKRFRNEMKYFSAARKCCTSLFRIGSHLIIIWGWKGYLALFSRQSEYADSSHRPCLATSSSQEPGKLLIFQVKYVVFWGFSLIFRKNYNLGI